MLLTLVLAPAGCGGDDGDGEATKLSTEAVVGGGGGETTERQGEGGGPGDGGPGDENADKAGEEDRGAKGDGTRGDGGKAERNGGPDRREGADRASGGGGDGETAMTPSKAVFIERADAICARRGEQIKGRIESQVKGGLQELPRRAPAIVEKTLAPGLDAEVREIIALGLPREDRAQAEAVLAAILEGVERAREDPQRFVLSGNAFARSERLGRKFGFSRCGGL